MLNRIYQKLAIALFSPLIISNILLSQDEQIRLTLADSLAYVDSTLNRKTLQSGEGQIEKWYKQRDALADDAIEAYGIIKNHFIETSRLSMCSFNSCCSLETSSNSLSVNFLFSDNFTINSVSFRYAGKRISVF